MNDCRVRLGRSAEFAIQYTGNTQISAITMASADRPARARRREFMTHPP